MELYPGPPSQENGGTGGSEQRATRRSTGYGAGETVMVAGTGVCVCVCVCVWRGGGVECKGLCGLSYIVVWCTIW